MNHTHQFDGVLPHSITDSTDKFQASSLASSFVKAEAPDGDYRDPITIGALIASRIASVPSGAIKRWARSATMIEIETGRDYHISGGTDWFEIHDGVVFTVQRTAKVAWAEGDANVGAGLWLICMGKKAGVYRP